MGLRIYNFICAKIIREKWEYFENGILKSHGSWTEKGLPTGRHSENHENGKQKFFCEYSDGKAQGAERAWNESGQLMREGWWSNNLKDGKWAHWWSNGNSSAEEYWENGTPTGYWKLWYENSRLYQQTKYDREGSVSAKQVWDEVGEIKELYITYRNQRDFRSDAYRVWPDKDGNLVKQPPRGYLLKRFKPHHFSAYFVYSDSETRRDARRSSIRFFKNRRTNCSYGNSRNRSRMAPRRFKD